MNKIVAISLLCSSIVAPAFAENDAYNYLEGGYISQEDGDGLKLQSNYLVNDDIFLNFNYSDLQWDGTDVSTSLMFLGAGYKHDLSAETSVYGVLNLAELNVDLGPASDSETGFSFGVGVKNQITPAMEAYGELARVDINNFEKNILSVGLKHQVANNVAAYAEYKSYFDSDDSDGEFGVGLTYRF